MPPNSNRDEFTNKALEAMVDKVQSETSIIDKILKRDPKLEPIVMAKPEPISTFGYKRVKHKKGYTKPGVYHTAINAKLGAGAATGPMQPPVPQQHSWSSLQAKVHGISGATKNGNGGLVIKNLSEREKAMLQKVVRDHNIQPANPDECALAFETEKDLCYSFLEIVGITSSPMNTIMFEVIAHILSSLQSIETRLKDM